MKFHPNHRKVNIMAIVTIGCRLPNGLVLEHPDDKTKKVTLSGKNKATIIGTDYALTPVDSDFWDRWMEVHSGFPALKSNAIFVAKNPNDAHAIAKEVAKERTGFEPMKQDSSGVKTAKED